jgi:hypothetical protein
MTLVQRDLARWNRYMSRKAAQTWHSLCKFGTHCHFSDALAHALCQGKGVLLSSIDYSAFLVRDASIQIDSGCCIA